MLIDLFNDETVLKDYNRLLAQVETRAFRLDCSEEYLKNLCSSDDDFYSNISALSQEERTYSHSYGCGCDSHFLLEAMGVGRDCKKYTIIYDMSNCLDYILHRLTGCSIDKVRQIKNYNEVSKGILTLNFEALENVTLGDILAIDPKITEWLISLIDNIVSGSNLTEGEIMDLLLLRFYRTILQEANSIKSYVIMYIRRHFSAVVRSKFLCGMLASSDVAPDTVITLTDNTKDNVEDYDMQIYVLESGEFFTKGVYHDFSWVY